MWEEISVLDKLLVQYIRNNDGSKKGMFISGVYNDVVCIGWSLCNKLDEFNTREAFYIAEGRAIANKRLSKHINHNGIYFGNVPSTVINALPKFIHRVVRYYSAYELSPVIDAFICTITEKGIV